MKEKFILGVESMKRLVGILIAVQVILTLVILYEMERIADTVMTTGAYIANKEGQLVIGNGVPTFFLIILGILGIISLYLLFSKDKPTK